MGLASATLIFLCSMNRNKIVLKKRNYARKMFEYIIENNNSTGKMLTRTGNLRINNTVKHSTVLTFKLMRVTAKSGPITRLIINAANKRDGV